MWIGCSYRTATARVAKLVEAGLVAERKDDA